MAQVLDYRTGTQHPINIWPSSAPVESPESEPEPASPTPESEPEPEPSSGEQPEELSQPEGRTKSSEEKAPGENGKERPLSRYERTKRRKEALRQREAALAAREEQLASIERARAERERKASEPDYTVEDLRRYLPEWEAVGNFDLADKAKAEIARLEQLERDKYQVAEIPRTGTKEFEDVWHSAEQELYQLDPEFMRKNTRLDATLREMMSSPDGAVYREHPRGIVAAYHRAKLVLTESDLASERTKNQKLEKELQRLNGLLGIGGGAAARGGSEGRDFSQLSTKEMRQHLISTM